MSDYIYPIPYEEWVGKTIKTVVYHFGDILVLFTDGTSTRIERRQHYEGFSSYDFVGVNIDNDLSYHELYALGLITEDEYERHETERKARVKAYETKMEEEQRETRRKAYSRLKEEFEDA